MNAVARIIPRMSRLGSGLVTSDIRVLRGIEWGSFVLTFRPYGSRARLGMNITLRRSMQFGASSGVRTRLDRM